MPSLGLHQAEDGTLRSNLLTRFYIGAEPKGERYEDAVARLESLGSITPPVTGSGALLINEAGQ